MKYIPHHYRQQNIDHMMWGKRLFVTPPKYETPVRAEPAPVSTHELIREGASDFVKWVGSTTFKFSADTLNTIATVSLSVPIGILEGLKNSFDGEESGAGDAFNKLFNQVGSFFRTEPDLKSIFDTHISAYDKKSLQKLTDHREWINAFVDLPTDFLSNPKVEEVPITGPRELMMHLPLEQRRAVYVRFVNKYIPEKVQKKMSEIQPDKNGKTTGKITWYDADPQKKIEKLARSNPRDREVIHHALKGILGMTGEGYLTNPHTEDGGAIAKESLEQYYHTDHPDFKHLANKDRLKRIPGSLPEDYNHALIYQKMKGIESIATDPKLVAKPLQYSEFKGALNLGVITHEMLADMYPIVTTEMEFERSRAIMGATNKYDSLMGVTDAMMENETKTMVERFTALHWGFKALMACGLLAALTNKWGRRVIGGGALAFGSAYAIQYFALGEDNPEKRWASLVSGPISALKRKNVSDVGQLPTPGTIGNIRDRANLYVNFAGKFDYVNMEDMGVGLGILSDMPLSELALSFQRGGKDQGQFYLDVERMDPLLQKSLEARGWSSTNYKRFYRNPENRKQTSEAMGWVFYLRAAKESGNAARVQFVESVRRDLIPGASISRLPGPWEHPDAAHTPLHASSDPDFQKKMVLAQQEYVRLVAVGHDLAMKDHQTLGTFALSQMAVQPPMEDEYEQKPSWTAQRLQDIGVSAADNIEYASDAFNTFINTVAPVITGTSKEIFSLAGYYPQVVMDGGRYVLALADSITRKTVILFGDTVDIASAKVQQIIRDVTPVLKELPGEMVKVVASDFQGVVAGGKYALEWLNEFGETIGRVSYDVWYDMWKAGYFVHGIPEEKYENFEAIKQSINGHAVHNYRTKNGENAGLQVWVIGTDKIDIRQLTGPGEPKFGPVITMEVDEFLTSNPSDLIEKWYKHAFTEKMKNFTFEKPGMEKIYARRIGEDVEFSTDPTFTADELLARDDVITFLALEPEQIYNAYGYWMDLDPNQRQIKKNALTLERVRGTPDDTINGEPDGKQK